MCEWKFAFSPRLGDCGNVLNNLKKNWTRYKVMRTIIIRN